MSERAEFDPSQASDTARDSQAAGGPNDQRDPRIEEAPPPPVGDSPSTGELASSLADTSIPFRELIEDSTQGILIHRDWKPLFVNAAYARILGYDSPEEILAQPSIEAHIPSYERERRRGSPASMRPSSTKSTRCARTDAS